MTTPNAKGNTRMTLLPNTNFTQIRGKSKSGSLKVLFNAIKENLQTVHLNIGREAHNYFILVLTPAKYAIGATGTPYIWSIFPDQLVIPSKHANINVQMLHETHK